MKHTLKCWPSFFDAIVSGEKTFEVRRNDRGFQKGDTVILERTLDETGAPDPYSCVRVQFEIGYVLSGMGIEPGYCVFSLVPVPANDGGGERGGGEETGRN